VSGAPDRLEEAIVRYDPAGAVGEGPEEVELARGQVDARAAKRHRMRLAVDRAFGEFAHCDIGERASLAAQRGADACEQFLAVERLGYEIVGTEVECGDLFLGRVARGKDNDRQAELCQLRTDLKTVAVGQA